MLYAPIALHAFKNSSRFVDSFSVASPSSPVAIQRMGRPFASSIVSIVGTSAFGATAVLCFGTKAEKKLCASFLLPNGTGRPPTGGGGALMAILSAASQSRRRVFCEVQQQRPNPQAIETWQLEEFKVQVPVGRRPGAGGGGGDLKHKSRAPPRLSGSGMPLTS